MNSQNKFGTVKQLLIAFLRIGTFGTNFYNEITVFLNEAIANNHILCVKKTITVIQYIGP